MRRADPAGAGPPDRPGPRALLATPAFLRLWLVGAFGNAMRWLELLVAGLFAYEATGSALAVALVLAARQLPQLLFGAFVGAISETVDRKTMLVAALAVPAAVSATLAALAAADALALWHVALGGFVSGTMWASEMPVRRRMAGEAAGPARLAEAVALDTTTGAATRLVGPLLGGLAFQTLGLAGIYGASAAVQFACAAAALGVARSVSARRLALSGLAADVGHGLRFARARPVLLLVFGLTVIMNAFAFACSGLLAPLGRGEFGVSPALVGVLAAAEPGGALLGGLLLASGAVRLDRRAVFVGGSAAFMAALAALAFCPSYWLAVALLVLGGIGVAGFGGMQSTLVLAETPPELRSRMLGIVTVCIGTGPVGVLMAGALAEAIGLRPALFATAVAGLALAAVLALALRRGGRVGNP